MSNKKPDELGERLLERLRQEDKLVLEDIDILNIENIVIKGTVTNPKEITGFEITLSPKVLMNSTHFIRTNLILFFEEEIEENEIIEDEDY
jgi:hypothetical protein